MVPAVGRMESSPRNQPGGHHFLLGGRETMSEQPTDDPFEDCELDPEAILGTRIYEDVLFSDETETPVNVLTGETPEHSQATVEEAQK